MNPLLTLLNHLVAEALQERPGQGALQVRSVTLDEEGARLVLWFEHAQVTGEAVLRIRAESPAGDQQRLVLSFDRLPETLGASLEPFRELLRKSRLNIELDFSP